MNTADEDVSRYLNLLTLLSHEQIEQIVSEHSKDPSKRYGQQELAYYVTKTVFGEKAADHTKQITDVLFGEGDKIATIASMNQETLVALNEATGKGTNSSSTIRLIEACVVSGLTESNGEAKKAIAANSIYVNEQLVSDIGYELSTKDFIGGKIALLRKGKKNYATIMIA